MEKLDKNVIITKKNHIYYKIFYLGNLSCIIVKIVILTTINTLHYQNLELFNSLKI